MLSRRLGLTPLLKQVLPESWWQQQRILPKHDSDAAAAYQQRLENENTQFASCENVHDLPGIFHYWSNKYLRPMLEQCGFSHPDQFFAFYMEKSFHGDFESPRHFASIGAGNCDTEVRLAVMLKERGYKRFVIECVDINRTMLERGRQFAKENGVADNVAFECSDFNSWSPTKTYDAVIANQSLHHVANLEHLYDAISKAIGAHGLFITSDMIGRNGHQRWPEALAIVKEFWRDMPEQRRFNLQLQRKEPDFLDWDCSTSGFEGIRSQDVLPLLVTRFQFDFFYGFANVIDPFIDRGFGHHFDPDSQADRDFIDRIHARDEAELDAGNIKPTHMFAVLRNGEPGTCLFSLGHTPTASVRTVNVST